MSNKEKKQGKIKAFFKSRKTKKGTVAFIILAAALAVVILLNVITGLLVERFPNLQFDMTSSGSYQLQKDTMDYLNQLDKDVTIYVLTSEKNFKSGLNVYSGAQYFVQANELLKKMAAQNSHVTLKYIDLSSNPTFTSKYDKIDWNSSDSNTLILIESGDDYTSLTLDDCFTSDKSSQYYQYYGYNVYTATTIEQAVITGILEVTTGEKTSVDFITGSGENSQAYDALVTLLKKNAYDVREINLLTQKLRDDSKIAVLYAPTVDLTEASADKLGKWLNNDGKMGRNLIYIPINESVKTPNIDALLKKYGMKVSDGLAYCTNSKYIISDYYTFITDYNNDTYTANLKNANVPVVVRDSRDVEILDKDTAKPLLSVESGAGMVPFGSDEDAKADDFLKADGINAAAIGTVSSDDEKKSNVVVFGSPIMFLSNYLETSYNNSNYFINVCNTITNRGDLGITINSAKNDSGELGTVTAEITAIVGVIFIGAIPLITLLIGLIVFIRRRTM
ncbi:MAG: GldG family protein [Ruminococcus sp.]|nr:GldG family protein [Ruminococcus sp.]